MTSMTMSSISVRTLNEFEVTNRAIILERNALVKTQYGWWESIHINPCAEVEEAICGTLSLTDTNISPSHFHDCHNIKNNDKVIIKSKNPYIKKGSSIQKSENNFDSSIPFIKDNMSFKNQDFHSFSTNAVS